MVQRYAHLAPRHLSAHAKQIDSIFDGHVPNMSQLETLEVMGFDKRLIFMALQDSNTSHITLVIKAFFSVRKTPEPPIRPPIVFR